MKIKDLPFKVMYKSALLHEVYVKMRFSTELQLLKGNHSVHNTHPSIIHFSLNRAASQYTKSLLCRCAKENGMTPVHMNEYARSNDLPFLDHLSAQQMQAYQHVFKPEGYCYSAFGGFVRGIPDLDRYLIILMIRDPRDMLTSLYYSTAFSHSPPADRTKGASFLDYRNHVRQMTVDEFVLSRMDEYSERCRIYVQELEDRPNVLVAKYEDMIGDFQQWLDEILSFCSLSMSEAARENLIAAASKSQNTNENQMKHMRQVVPGDYSRKLKPETVATLNSGLADLLGRYGYV